MTHRLAERLALGLELLAGGAVLVPGLRKLGEPDRLEPRFAIRVLVAKDAPGNAEPFLAIVANGNRLFVKAALLLADFLGNVADVGHAVGIELRPVVERANHIWAGPRLNGGRGARLDVVAVDHFNIERDAEILGGGRDNLLAQDLVGPGNEIVPAQPVHRGALRVGRRPSGRQNCSKSSARRSDGAGTRNLKQFSPMNPSHWNPPSKTSTIAFLVGTFF